MTFVILGVETISIQSKGAPESRPANAPSAQIPTSPTDTDINLSFSLDTENISKPTNTDVVDGGLPVGPVLLPIQTDCILERSTF